MLGWLLNVFLSLPPKKKGTLTMFVRTMTGCTLAVSLMVVVGCQQGPARLYPPPIDASAAGAKAIEMYDTDKDGKISGAELDKCPALKAAMAQIDTTGEGSITAEKITARIKAWQESKLGRTSVTCTVLHNGKPLSNAEVKFVPEKFLGDNMQTASGKTDQNGVAMISVPTTGRADPPGVAPGLYRVEITEGEREHPGEVQQRNDVWPRGGLGRPGPAEGIKFDLKY